MGRTIRHASYTLLQTGPCAPKVPMSGSRAPSGQFGMSSPIVTAPDTKLPCLYGSNYSIRRHAC